MSDMDEKTQAEERARETSQKAFRAELIKRIEEDKAKTDLIESKNEAITQKITDHRAFERKRFKDNARRAFLASPLAEESDFEKLYPKILERYLLDEVARVMREQAEL